MKRRKATAAVMAAAIGLSTLAYVPFLPAGQAKAATMYKEGVHTDTEAPIDLGVANDEKLIAMLKQKGKLAADASHTEAQQALHTFLKAKAEAAKKTTEKQPGEKLGQLPKNTTELKSTQLTNGKGNKLGQTKKDQVPPVKAESYQGEIRQDRVLVLAIDFPDYEQSSITETETAMFYEEYSQEHFQNMIFGDDGYTGPDGKNLISMKQYYEQQSGGSYTVEGTVAGWYTADHPAAYYGGNTPAPDGIDARPRQLVYEALTKAGQDPNLDLSEYDVWDNNDYDNDGVKAEADGIIDHLMVIHAGVGEEAGGGTLAEDAIWSHRSNLGGLIAVPGGTSNSERFGGLLGAYNYTMEPEDGAAGVFIHEFAHDLGLPDEYDTIYSGAGEPVSYWSIMASGSWAGVIPGTEPTGFSPYAKQYLQTTHGGNWLTGATFAEENITEKGMEVLLDEGATKGTNNDAVRINLPDKVTTINTPVSGKYEYFSGKGNNLHHSMHTTIDLTNATKAELTFKAWYDIEEHWDYASVKINGTSIAGNITTIEDPEKHNPGHGITGSSDGWVDAAFDLSAYAGQEVTLSFDYWTDSYVDLPGFYVDDIGITADDSEILLDDAESDSVFSLDGFKKDKGKAFSEHYYLLEWRSHSGVDQGLANIRRNTSLLSYHPGLVVWYVDHTYDNNWTGVHPGDGFLGVVDADQHANYWSNGEVADTRYQLNDAAFRLTKTDKTFLDYSTVNGTTLKDNFTKRMPLFEDSANYRSTHLTDAGRNIPNYGLKFRVTGQSKDGTVGSVFIFK